MASSAESAVATFLDVYEREHEITMRVLRAFPPERADLRPHPKCKTARELAWVFVLERGLGTMLMKDAFASAAPAGEAPATPDRWEDVLSQLEAAHREFGDYVATLSDEDLDASVSFFVAPKTMGSYRRREALWFLLHDQIHHRGQFSIYLRMADGKVPSIYGPTADEPWM